MADFVTAGTQTVEVNGSVLFAANRVYSCNCPNIRHEPLSGRVVLLPGLYRVGFNGNFSAAAAGDVIFEIQQDGEGIPGARIQNTVAACATINGAATVEVRVCKPCCATLSVKNVGATAATVSDANLVVSRIG